MEHDRLEDTHSQPSYQHKLHAHPAEMRTIVEVATSVVVITPPREGESDFTEERPPKKPSPQWHRLHVRTHVIVTDAIAAPTLQQGKSNRKFVG